VVKNKFSEIKTGEGWSNFRASQEAKCEFGRARAYRQEQVTATIPSTSLSHFILTGSGRHLCRDKFISPDCRRRCSKLTHIHSSSNSQVQNTSFDPGLTFALRAGAMHRNSKPAYSLLFHKPLNRVHSVGSCCRTFVESIRTRAPPSTG
jgi:hypothetical protein